MKDFEKFIEFNIKLKQETVFHLIDCYLDSPIYEEVLKEYQEMEQEVCKLIKPVAFLKFGQPTDTMANQMPEYIEEGTPMAYILISIGNEIAEHASQCFEKGDYLAGLMVNAMADTYLFQIDEVLQDIIRDRCACRQLGIAKRLEAPEGMPMNMQKDILDEIKKMEKLPIEVTEGFMFTTVKTTGYILVLTKDLTTEYSGHNCDACSQVSCKLRKNTECQITLTGRGEPIQFTYDGKMSLMDAMIKQGIYISASCGGRGTCGKCKVQVTEGNLDITSSDTAKLTDRELEQGYRLSCKAYPKKNCTVRMATGDESDFEVVTQHQEIKIDHDELRKEDYVIAADIGSTTIAISLIGVTSKKTIYTYTTINKQRAYGADVISRMKASMDGKKQELQESIQKDLTKGIRSIIEEVKIEKSQIQKIALAGNTTMIHLLMGYSCETLGVYPFTPVNIETIHAGFMEVMGNDYLDVPVTILPGISTYVGGDIVAGLFACDFDQSEKIGLIIDLGTNGEMAIGNKEKILVSSTAAGPAFEGGNISCGIGSITGAICNVAIEKEEVIVQTIGQKAPQGICGTGIIELTSELVKAKLVDETGLYCDEYFEEGFPLGTDPFGNAIVFTQKDVREIQLAKSAVRAGVEILIRRYGITYDQIDKVYLAGGFGYKINLWKAIHIGMLPEELYGKMTAIGNSSLGGTVKYLLEDTAPERVERITGVSSEINLSNDKDFNELYIDYMFFSE